MVFRLTAWWSSFRFRAVVLEALVSVCLAFLVWLYTYTRARTTIEHVQIPIQIQLVAHQRDQYLLDVPGRSRISVTFSGPNARMRELKRKLLSDSVQLALPFTVPDDKLNEAVYSDVVIPDTAHVAVPPGVTVEIADDLTSIPVTVHRLSERLLPVRLDNVGDFRVMHLKVEPAAVRVRGPRALIEKLADIATQPYALPLLQEQSAADPMVRDQIALVTEVEGRPIQTTPSVVQFRCRVVPKLKVYEIADVPIHFLCPPDFPWRAQFAQPRQAKVTLQLQGPVSDEPPSVQAYVDLTSSPPTRGRNVEPLRLQLPKDFQLVSPGNPLVAFTLEEVDRPAPSLGP